MIQWQLNWCLLQWLKNVSHKLIPFFAGSGLAVDDSAMLVEDLLSSFGCSVVVLLILLFSGTDIGVLVFCWFLIMLSEMFVIFSDCNFSAICWKYCDGGCGDGGLSHSLESCSNCWCNFFGWCWVLCLGVKSPPWFLATSCFESACWFVGARKINSLSMRIVYYDLTIMLWR